MADHIFLLCASIAAIGWAIGMGTATAAPKLRPRRITWDEPADAD
jgi:hypothetical protein